MNLRNNIKSTITRTQNQEIDTRSKQRMYIAKKIYFFFHTLGNIPPFSLYKTLHAYEINNMESLIQNLDIVTIDEQSLEYYEEGIKLIKVSVINENGQKEIINKNIETDTNKSILNIFSIYNDWLNGKYPDSEQPYKEIYCLFESEYLPELRNRLFETITSNILYAIVKYEYEKNGEKFLDDYDSQKFQILAQHLEKEYEAEEGRNANPNNA